MITAPDPWMIFRSGEETAGDRLAQLPPPPSWRTSKAANVGQPIAPKDLEQNPLWRPEKGKSFQLKSDEILKAVNAALYLRRPLLLTGQPGTGKSSLIYSVAYKLGMGPVLKWSITSRATLKSGLYDYDALRRLNDIRQKEAGKATAANAEPQEADDIGNYLTLGPLGAALYPTDWPRPLLIDEIDKADLDLPNDLLNIFEDGEFLIPELARGKEGVYVKVPGLQTRQWVPPDGRIIARQFPFVVLTSNNEREFPAPFLRRCIRAQMPVPTLADLADIVEVHLGDQGQLAKDLIDQFDKDKAKLATDQLLNAVFLTVGSLEHQTAPLDKTERDALIKILLQHLG